MGDLRALNVFVLDHAQRPVPGATVTLLLDGEPLAEATTRGLSDAPILMQVPDAAPGLSLEARIGDQTWREPIARDKVTYTFSLSELAVRSKIKVFVSYAHEDRKQMERLGRQLKGFEKKGLIYAWFDSRMLGGDDFDSVIKARLEESQIVLILVSPDFVSSTYCMETEVPWALAATRRKTNPIILVPIVIRPTARLEREAFHHLLKLPRDGKPVSKWRPVDDGWMDVIDSLGRIFDALQPAVSAEGTTIAPVFPGQPGFDTSLGRLRENPSIGKAALLPRPERLPPQPQPDTPFDTNDPQRERWGGRSEVEGLRLSATVNPARQPEWFNVVLTVEDTIPGRKLSGDVYFYLHQTFNPSRVKVSPDDAGRAVFSVLAWGAFTVGAWIDDERHTTLELNLAALEGVDLAFRRR